MNLYIVKVEWIYEEREHIIGVCDADHIEEMQEAYKTIYKQIAQSIRNFSVEEFELNKAYA